MRARFTANFVIPESHAGKGFAGSGKTRARHAMRSGAGGACAGATPPRRATKHAAPPRAAPRHRTSARHRHDVHAGMPRARSRNARSDAPTQRFVHRHRVASTAKRRRA
ncbi:hypothetical protein [Cupriavidus ulmosensis]